MQAPHQGIARSKTEREEGNGAPGVGEWVARGVEWAPCSCNNQAIK